MASCKSGIVCSGLRAVGNNVESYLFYGDLGMLQVTLHNRARLFVFPPVSIHLPLRFLARTGRDGSILCYLHRA